MFETTSNKELSRSPETFSKKQDKSVCQTTPSILSAANVKKGRRDDDRHL